MITESKNYIKASFWEIREAVILLFGGKPIDDDGNITGPWDERHIDAYELALRSIKARDLPTVGKRKKRRVEPARFTNWANDNGYEIPPVLQPLINEKSSRDDVKTHPDLNHNQELQALANQLAEKHKKSHNRIPTRKSIALMISKIHNNSGLAADTIERRIRKEW